MLQKLRGLRIIRGDEGASAVEYGLLIAGIAFVIFASIMFLGQTVMNNFYANAQRLFG